MRQKLKKNPDLHRRWILYLCIEKTFIDHQTKEATTGFDNPKKIQTCIAGGFHICVLRKPILIIKPRRLRLAYFMQVVFIYQIFDQVCYIWEMDLFDDLAYLVGDVFLPAWGGAILVGALVLWMNKKQFIQRVSHGGIMLTLISLISSSH